MGKIFDKIEKYAIFIRIFSLLNKLFMDLKTFRALYASTFVHEPLLAAFWSAAVYDLEGSIKSWIATRKGIEANALKQRELLEKSFRTFFPNACRIDAA